jgi:hypothetical protein
MLLGPEFLIPIADNDGTCDGMAAQQTNARGAPLRLAATSVRLLFPKKGEIHQLFPLALIMICAKSSIHKLLLALQVRKFCVKLSSDASTASRPHAPRVTLPLPQHVGRHPGPSATSRADS